MQQEKSIVLRISARNIIKTNSRSKLYIDRVSLANYFTTAKLIGGLKQKKLFKDFSTDTESSEMDTLCYSTDSYHCGSTTKTTMGISFSEEIEMLKNNKIQIKNNKEENFAIYGISEKGTQTTDMMAKNINELLTKRIGGKSKNYS